MRRLCVDTCHGLGLYHMDSVWIRAMGWACTTWAGPRWHSAECPIHTMQGLTPHHAGTHPTPCRDSPQLTLALPQVWSADGSERQLTMKGHTGWVLALAAHGEWAGVGYRQVLCGAVWCCQMLPEGMRYWFECTPWLWHLPPRDAMMRYAHVSRYKVQMQGVRCRCRV